MERYFFIFIMTLFCFSCSNLHQEKQETISTSQILIDTKATSQTISLYERLRKISDKGFLYGHQDDLAYGLNWWNKEGNSDVKAVCGSYPAVFGWELGDLGHERNLDSIKFTNIQKWIIKAHEMGGINTISWHMLNPVTMGNSWDQTKAVSSILPGGYRHNFFKDHLKRFASFNKALTDSKGKQIPIIFRPWHEHNGSWFWWGKEHCTIEEYKTLWKYTVDYLRDTLNIHNLIYTYSPDGQFDDYSERYPGDDYVDMLGFDYYFRGELTESSIEDFSNKLINLTTLANTKNKVAILSETGYESIPDKEWHTKAILNPIKTNKKNIKIAYLLTWRNFSKKHHYAPYPGHASEKDFMDFYNDSLTYFLNDIINVNFKNVAKN
jgi:mannan endo-1,4-beta-mannosidase